MGLSDIARRTTSILGGNAALRRKVMYAPSFRTRYVVGCVMVVVVPSLVSCTRGQNSIDTPIERSFDSLEEYASWCGQLRIDNASDFRTHGEFLDAMELRLDTYRLATPLPEVAELHDLRTNASEIMVDMFSHYPREGKPYDTIHVAAPGGNHFASVANQLIRLYGELPHDVVDTLKADDCIQ